MSEHTPTTEDMRRDYSRGVLLKPAMEAEFDRWLSGELAKAWEAGHRHRQRRGPDKCQCGAYYSGECGCGLYGTGPLVSLDDNPHKGES